MYYLNLNNFEKGELIGKGSFGAVYKVREKSTGKFFAVKIMNTRHLKFFMNEVDTLIKCNQGSYSNSCTNVSLVLRINGFSMKCFDGHFPGIITDYIPNGTLESALKLDCYSRSFLSITEKYIILLGIACGMEIVHKNEIIHRDLKPGNVFLNEKKWPIIGDFGSSHDNESDCTGMRSGSLIYQAPEQETNSGSYPADVYSYALTAFEILENIQRKLPNVLNNEKPPYSDVVVINKNVEQMLKRCLDDDPAKRPTFSDIVNFFLNDRIIQSLEKSDHIEVKYIDEYIDMIGKKVIYDQTDIIYDETDKKIENNEEINVEPYFENDINFWKGVEYAVDKERNKDGEIMSGEELLQRSLALKKDKVVEMNKIMSDIEIDSKKINIEKKNFFGNLKTNFFGNNANIIPNKILTNITLKEKCEILVKVAQYGSCDDIKIDAILFVIKGFLYGKYDFEKNPKMGLQILNNALQIFDNNERGKGALNEIYGVYLFKTNTKIMKLWKQNVRNGINNRNVLNYRDDLICSENLENLKNYDYVKLEMLNHDINVCNQEQKKRNNENNLKKKTSDDFNLIEKEILICQNRIESQKQIIEKYLSLEKDFSSISPEEKNKRINLFSKCLEHLMIAHEKGNTKATCFLGLYYIKVRNFRDALFYLNASKEGQKNANYAIAKIKWRVEKRRDEAVEFFRRAAAGDHQISLMILGFFFVLRQLKMNDMKNIDVLGYIGKTLIQSDESSLTYALSSEIQKLSKELNQQLSSLKRKKADRDH